MGARTGREVFTVLDGCAKRRKPPGRCLCFRTSAPVAEALPSLGASARFTSRAGRRFVDSERARALALARSGFHQDTYTVTTTTRGFLVFFCYATSGPRLFTNVGTLRSLPVLLPSSPSSACTARSSPSGGSCASARAYPSGSRPGRTRSSRPPRCRSRSGQSRTRSAP